MKFKLVKVVIGQLLLLSVILLILKKGELFNHINLSLLISTTLLSAFLIILNSMSIKLIANAYNTEKSLPFIQALQIGALSTFGNSLGGLPIGTSLKFFILNRVLGIKLACITAGLVLFALAISCFFLICILLTILFLDYELIIKISTTVLIVFIFLVILLLGKIFSKNKNVIKLVSPMLSNYKWQVAILSLFLSFGLVLNYIIVGSYLAPEINSIKIAFLASLGSLASVLTFSQTVGGVQEISIGIASVLSDVTFIEGVEFAFVLRVAALIASGIILLPLIPSILNYKKSIESDN